MKPCRSRKDRLYYDHLSNVRCIRCGHFKPHWKHAEINPLHGHPFEGTPPEHDGRPLPVPADTASGGERNDTPGANEASATRLPPASNGGVPSPAKEKVVWACPGCGQVCTSPKGLAWHLTAIGPGYASLACKAAEVFYNT